ncbi:MAG: helix-turn-helix domain-containing protein [Oscillospiraceae bacterium]|nr:helix-turn-helix domain-containing protein [Oscillospiraceae bacterium]
MNRIKHTRFIRGISQKEVATTLGVAQPTVSNWEKGTKTPGASNYQRLASLFGVSVDYLMGFSDEGGLTSLPLGPPLHPPKLPEVRPPKIMEGTRPIGDAGVQEFFQDLNELVDRHQDLLGAQKNKPAAQEGQPASERDITMAKIAARLNEMNDKEFSRAVEIFRLLDSE